MKRTRTKEIFIEIEITRVIRKRAVRKKPPPRAKDGEEARENIKYRLSNAD